MSRKVGIIGYPLGHSISPAFQQAAFDALGLDVRYEVWQVEPGRLPEALRVLRHPDTLGANVTIPYKEAALPLLDELDHRARWVGAVNTIVNESGRLKGYNTDIDGFLRALVEDGGFDAWRKRAIVLGAGGSARAVCFGLAEKGVAYLGIVNRTLERAGALADALAFLPPKVEVLAWDSALPDSYDLLVNCTSIGMRHGHDEGKSPVAGRRLPPGAMVCDLVYSPPETPLLAQARGAGCRVLGGLPMLVYQGAASFSLWTGRPAPVGVMMEAARRALAVPS